MSEWLERELARGLAPVAAPGMLGVRLGLGTAKRREFPGAVLAVAAAVVLVIGGGYAASRTAAFDVRQLTAKELRGTRTVESGSTRPVAVAAWLGREAGLDVVQGCDGATDKRFQRNAGKATVLVAHARSEGLAGWKIPEHSLAATTDAGCRLCHNL